MPKTQVILENDYHTEITARDHVWHADLPEDENGTNKASTPEEILMGALGSCMAQTAKLYAARKGWQIDRLEVRLDFERLKAAEYEGYEGDATFVHEVTEEIILEGPLDDAQRERILEIMGKCPVRRVLANPVFFKSGEPLKIRE